MSDPETILPAPGTLLSTPPAGNPTLPPPPDGLTASQQQLASSREPSTEGLKSKIIARLETGKLTEEQVERALRVVDAINDSPTIEKFLNNGGVALLAKLDGLPAQEQRELVNLVAERKAYLHTLNEFLDKYHDPKNVLGATQQERDQKLREFIDSAEQIGDAARLSSLMRAGGVAKVIQTAGDSLGGETIAGGGSTDGFASSQDPTYVTSPISQIESQLETVVTKLFDASRSKASLGAMIQQQELEKTLLGLAAELRRKKEEEEEACASHSMWPSKKAADELRLAFQELSEIAGPQVAAPLQQLVQILNRGDQPGVDYTIEQLLALVALLGERSDNRFSPPARGAPQRPEPPSGTDPSGTRQSPGTQPPRTGGKGQLTAP